MPSHKYYVGQLKIILPNYNDTLFRIIIFFTLIIFPNGAAQKRVKIHEFFLSFKIPLCLPIKLISECKFKVAKSALIYYLI